MEKALETAHLQETDAPILQIGSFPEFESGEHMAQKVARALTQKDLAGLEAREWVYRNFTHESTDRFKDGKKYFFAKGNGALSGIRWSEKQNRFTAEELELSDYWNRDDRVVYGSR